MKCDRVLVLLLLLLLKVVVDMESCCLLNRGDITLLSGQT